MCRLPDEQLGLLLEECWQAKPSRRITAGQLLGDMLLWGEDETPVMLAEFYLVRTQGCCSRSCWVHVPACSLACSSRFVVIMLRFLVCCVLHAASLCSHGYNISELRSVLTASRCPWLALLLHCPLQMADRFCLWVRYNDELCQRIPEWQFLVKPNPITGDQQLRGVLMDREDG